MTAKVETSAEIEPVEKTEIQVDPTSRWQVRAHSISECVEKLSEVWSSAAVQTELPDVSADATERAKGDPRLASHMVDTASSVRVRMRTSVLTLVVVAPRPETAERAVAAINHLNQRHPSRAIGMSPG